MGASQDLRVRRLAGRCANGAERDRGAVWHAVPKDSWTALCGAKPGKRSAGWSSEQPEGAASCEKCNRKVLKMAEPAVCGGCADDIESDDTAGAGGCAACGDGVPRCSECHEAHCAECDAGAEA